MKRINQPYAPKWELRGRKKNMPYHSTSLLGLKFQQLSLLLPRMVDNSLELSKIKTLFYYIDGI
jgi:hypothetical protein